MVQLSVTDKLEILADAAKHDASCASSGGSRRGAKGGKGIGSVAGAGIIRSSDYTMEQLLKVVRSLREEHEFRGYIHLKTIPDTDPEPVRQTGPHADRVSTNVALPTAEGLGLLAPDKSASRIDGAMAGMHDAIEEGPDVRKRVRHAPPTVFGEGPLDAALMLVGEQLGDQEYLVGRPFVGPAGSYSTARWARPCSTAGGGSGSGGAGVVTEARRFSTALETNGTARLYLNHRRAPPSVRFERSRETRPPPTSTSHSHIG